MGSGEAVSVSVQEDCNWASPGKPKWAPRGGPSGLESNDLIVATDLIQSGCLKLVGHCNLALDSFTSTGGSPRRPYYV